MKGRFEGEIGIRVQNEAQKLSLRQTAEGVTDNSRETVLECRNVVKRFGGLTAVASVSLKIPEGYIFGVIGPNGAGKTTLFNCVTGLDSSDSGEILLAGRRIDGLRMDQIARVGVVRTFQNLRIFKDLTVFEHLLAGQHSRRRLLSLISLLGLTSARHEQAEIFARAAAAMELVGLTQYADQLAHSLPLLEQRKVEIARALVSEPRVLLLDEPTSGATPAEADELCHVIETINASGVTIILIEHSMRVIMRLSRLIAVLNFGELVATGTPKEIQANSTVRKVYLGGNDAA